MRSWAARAVVAAILLLSSGVFADAGGGAGWPRLALDEPSAGFRLCMRHCGGLSLDLPELELGAPQRGLDLRLSAAAVADAPFKPVDGPLTPKAAPRTPDSLRLLRPNLDFELYAQSNPDFFHLWDRIAAATRLDLNPGRRVVLSFSAGFERYDYTVDRWSEERYLYVLAGLGNRLAADQRERLIRTWVVGSFGLRARLTPEWLFSCRVVVGLPFQGAWLVGFAADATPSP